MKTIYRLTGRVLVGVGCCLATYATHAGAVRSGFDSSTVPISSSDPYDNASVGPVSLGFPVSFYCGTYTNVYVNENGSITFDAFNGGTWYELYQLSQPIIAPFYADADARPVGSISHGSGTVDGHNAFGVTWNGVGYAANHNDKTNRFQCIIISRSDVASGAFELEYNYDAIQWETGDYNSGSGGLGGLSAIAGFSDGALTAMQLPGSGISGSFLDSNTNSGLIHNSRDSSVAGRYRFNTSSFGCLTNGSALSLTALGFTTNGNFSFSVEGATNAGCSVYGYFGFGQDDLGQLIGGVHLENGVGVFTDPAILEGGRLYRVHHGDVCASVGYVTLTVGPQTTLIANQFYHPSGNTVTTLLPSLPTGTTLRKWNEGTQAYVTNTFSSGWSDTNMTLNPGEGAFIDNPTTNAFSITFMGTMADGVLSNNIPAGISIRSYMPPQWGTPDSFMLDADFSGGETLSRWNTETQSFDVYTKATGSWEWTPEMPVINVGEAFVLEVDSATPWAREWSRCAAENEMR